uniref:Uncharacterized protein n=1 Tax=Arundo donax TaxID=35708 RepID=A0A0A9GWI8_ARUDO
MYVCFFYLLVSSLKLRSMKPNLITSQLAMMN